MTLTPSDLPARYGQPVTERHTAACRAEGHVRYTQDGKPSWDMCARCGDFPVDPVHPNIIAMWRGTVVESLPGRGHVVIEFADMSAAASWARTNEISDRVTLHSESAHAGHTFAEPVRITYRVLDPWRSKAD